VKLGYLVGAGLFLFALTLVLAQFLIKRARGATATG
jgi:hypothetical protein